jgi:hypothetical protein
MFEGEVDQPMREGFIGMRVTGIAVQAPALWLRPEVATNDGPNVKLDHGGTEA